MPEHVPVVVVGAGPAGLATSQQLRQRGVPHRVLEGGDAAGHTWANLYDSLTLHTGKHMSSLPGMPFPRSAPLFLPRRDFWDYLRRYVVAFELPVQTGATVTRLARSDGAWTLSTTRGPYSADTVVVATGIVANPKRPQLPGEERFAGRIAHSVTYRRPDPYRGRRVLVIGVGNSGAEIASEIARAGGRVSVAVRAGVAELTADGARFTDGTVGQFDDIILATGFEAALGLLGTQIQIDPKGFARRRDRVVSLDQPDLYVVGHNYDATGGLYNINRDAQLAAGLIARRLTRASP